MDECEYDKRLLHATSHTHTHTSNQIKLGCEGTKRRQRDTQTPNKTSCDVSDEQSDEFISFFFLFSVQNEANESWLGNE